MVGRERLDRIRYCPPKNGGNCGSTLSTAFMDHAGCEDTVVFLFLVVIELTKEQMSYMTSYV